MRRLVAAVAVMLAATAAMAADAGKAKTQLSIFTSNLGFFISNHDSTYTGGLGIALSRAFTRNWSAELRVAEEQHWRPVVIYTDPQARPVYEHHSYRVLPVDLLTQYQFPNRSRWTPYVNAGLRYVGMQDQRVAAAPPGLAPRANLYGDRMSGEIGAGTALRITPHFGLRFDANLLLRSRDVYYDPLFRPSAGVHWRF